MTGTFKMLISPNEGKTTVHRCNALRGWYCCAPDILQSCEVWPLLSVCFDVIKLCKKEQVENPVMTFFTYKYKDLKIMYRTWE